MLSMSVEQMKAVGYLVCFAVAGAIGVAYSIYERRRKGAGGEPAARPRRTLDPLLCAYVKKNGEQCQHEPKRGSRYCALHSRKDLMRRIESAPRQRVYEIDPGGR